MNLYSAIYRNWHPLDTFFPEAECSVVNHPDDMQGPGILIVHGGADISPALYGKGRSHRTFAEDHPSHRDSIEWALMHSAKQKNIFIFGICRGAQMLCAAAGGYLIQDVDNHAGAAHMVVDDEGTLFSVNSLHHQMQAPWGVNHIILAKAHRKLSDYYLDENTMVQVPEEPEAVFYPDFKGLGVQWHPEMLNEKAVSNKWIKEKLEHLL